MPKEGRTRTPRHPEAEPPCLSKLNILRAIQALHRGEKTVSMTPVRSGHYSVEVDVADLFRDYGGTPAHDSYRAGEQPPGSAVLARPPAGSGTTPTVVVRSMTRLVPTIEQAKRGRKGGQACFEATVVRLPSARPAT